MGNSVGKRYLIMKHAQLATCLSASHLASLHPATSTYDSTYSYYVLQFTHTMSE